MSSPDYSSDDSSDHSYDDERHQRACPYQTPRHHDQECSRYFDCPTHTIERAASDNAPSGDEQEADDGADPGDLPAEGQYDEEGRDSLDPSSPQTEAEPADQHDAEAPSRERTNDESSRHVIDLTSSSPEQRHDALAVAGPSNPAQGRTQQPPQVIDLTGDSPPAEDVSRARAEKSRQGRALPAMPLSEEAGSSSSQGRPGAVSPSAQRRPGTPPSPPPPLRRRTSTNNFGTAPRPPQPPPQAQTQRPVQARRPSDIVLPRWQPDAEVTICPICRTQFSFLVRKHHCRYASILLLRLRSRELTFPL